MLGLCAVIQTVPPGDAYQSLLAAPAGLWCSRPRQPRLPAPPWGPPPTPPRRPPQLLLGSRPHLSLSAKGRGGPRERWALAPRERGVGGPRAAAEAAISESGGGCPVALCRPRWEARHPTPPGRRVDARRGLWHRAAVASARHPPLAGTTLAAGAGAGSSSRATCAVGGARDVGSVSPLRLWCAALSTNNGGGAAVRPLGLRLGGVGRFRSALRWGRRGDATPRGPLARAPGWPPRGRRTRPRVGWAESPCPASRARATIVPWRRRRPALPPPTMACPWRPNRRRGRR